MIELNGKEIQLQTERLQLRPLLVEDVTLAYIQGLNDPEVNRYMVSVRSQTQTKATVVDFVHHNIEAPFAVLFGMFLKPDHQLVGTVRLHAYDATHHIATIGVCLFVREQWGKGLSSEALHIVSEWALEHLPIHYLEAACYVENVGSEKAFLKAGYERAVRFEDKYLYEGKPVPVTFLKFTKSERKL